MDERYFDTMGITLLRAGSSGPLTTAPPPLVAVVNETLARRYWPASEPIGKRLRVPRARRPAGRSRRDRQHDDLRPARRAAAGCDLFPVPAAAAACEMTLLTSTPRVHQQSISNR